MKAIDVARHFLFLARSFDGGDTISNLKMQKMLYYAQGWHLALTSKELFGDVHLVKSERSKVAEMADLLD